MKPAKLIALSAIAALSMGVIAAEVNLTAEEKQVCEEQGGCILAPLDFIKARIEAAYRAGFERGTAYCKSAT